MKYELKIPFFLIWKHLQRGNKWTLGLIVFLMAIAFVNLVFVSFLFNGIIEETNNQVINTAVGHIFLSPKEGNDFIDNRDAILEKIEKIEGVKAASAEILIPASLKYKNIRGSWQIFAIDPEREKKVTNIAEKIIEGEYLKSEEKDKIVIGWQIAGGHDVEMEAFSFKGAKVGDKVTLSFDNISREFTIKGIFYSKFIDTDQRAFITYSALSEMMPSFNNKASNIIIRLNNEYKNKEDLIIQKLKEEKIEENFYRWQDMAGLMKTVTKSFLIINILMSLVGVLIAAITIFIVVYIDISNKSQQIGILRAIGIKSYLIRSTYILQTVMYSFFGVLLGLILLFGIIIPYFDAYPIELPIGDVSLSVNYSDLVIRAEVIILVAIISGLIPAYIITKRKILDAIWGNQ